MKFAKRQPRSFIRILLAVIPGLAVAIVLYFSLTGNWFATWKVVRVTPLSIHFLDLYRRGGDPLIANPLDPMRRPLNYPHLMLFLFTGLGISAKNLIYFAISLAGIALLVFAWRWQEMDAIRRATPISPVGSFGCWRSRSRQASRC
jgi:hypothetical protein